MLHNPYRVQVASNPFATNPFATNLLPLILRFADKVQTEQFHLRTDVTSSNHYNGSPGNDGYYVTFVS